MAMAVRFDSQFSDDGRRFNAYQGAVYIDSPRSAAVELCRFARELIEDAFDGLDPETAQHVLPVERYVEILVELKPRFIHHPRSTELLRAMLAERGCDLDLTYFDVPRLRTSTSDGYLTSGIAYAWHPHRDTWYSAPLAQQNFWMPVYDITPTNAMALHLDHFEQTVANNSSIYNYYEWNRKHRAAAASNVGADSRPLPGPTEELDLSNSAVFVMPVGGTLHFSGQHLHSSVPNTSGVTRYSIDFRTVHIGDIRAGLGARNIDSACTGSSIRDFIRAGDFSAMPADVVARFADGTEDAGDLVYQPPVEART